MNSLIAVVLLNFCVQSAFSVKILGIFPTQVKSHYILGRSLMRGLAEKGNDVTVISPIGEKDFSLKNGTYRDIVVTYPAQGRVPDTEEILKMNFVSFALTMNKFGDFLTEVTLADPKVQHLLKSNEKFDVVVVEQFIDDGLKVFAHHYQAPLVLFVTCGSNAWINPLVGNPAPPSYIPEQHIYFDYRNFFHRLRNTIIYVFGELNRNFLFFPSQEKIVKKYFPEAPSIDNLLYNASLVLINSDWSTNMAVPRVPNMVDIGGFHVDPPKKLPKDLQNYLDSAKDGVVYFSMGSVMQSASLKTDKRDAFLKVFSKLKQKVLWKWEDDALPGQPANVKLAKWLPQQDILAHPNVRAFITHAGLLSLTETVYYGVPVLAIPLIADQVWNAVEVAASGYGRYVLFDEVNEEKLEELLHDVLNNPKYREIAKRRSFIMKDRQQKPIDDADYWIKYVIRHQGAPHLRVPGLNLMWYQYLLLDVGIFIFGVVSLVIYVLYYAVKIIVKKADKKTKRE